MMTKLKSYLARGWCLRHYYSFIHSCRWLLLTATAQLWVRSLELSRDTWQYCWHWGPPTR